MPQDKLRAKNLLFTLSSNDNDHAQSECSRSFSMTCENTPNLMKDSLTFGFSAVKLLHSAMNRAPTL